MQPLGDHPIRLRHLGDLREQVALPRGLVLLGLQLTGALLHGGALLGSEGLLLR
jgi:hypothetical protein